MAALLIGAALVVIAAAIATRWGRRSLGAAWSVGSVVHGGGRVLLVTAHPDDECMFFAPAIRALITHSRATVDILCCSRGDADGLGDVRVHELAAAATVLGLADVTVADDPGMRDGMAEVWQAQAVAEAIDRVAGRSYDALMTFDVRGVSGHPNHVAVARAVASYCAEHRLPLLELVSATPKYIGALAIVLEAVLHRRCSDMARKLRAGASHAIAVLSARDHWQRAVAAMLRHRSQMQWFRWLYVLFSRHMHVSVVRVIRP